MPDNINNFLSYSTDDTENAGRNLADWLIKADQGNAFVALYGELGAGKTAFVRGFVDKVSPGSAVRSPTYTIVNEYRGDPCIFHFDMYRITDEDDLYSTGFYDYLDRSGICICEWSENIPYVLPHDSVKVVISKSAQDEDWRDITIQIPESVITKKEDANDSN